MTSIFFIPALRISCKTPSYAFITTGISWLLLVNLLLAGCSDNRILLPRLPADAVILAFGDSLTFGTGADHTQSYPAVLEKLSGRTVINAGVPGEVSAAGMQRLPALLDRHKPGLLILCHGANDLLRKMSSATAQANIETMITAAAQRDIPVLLIGVPQPALMFLKPAKIYNDIAAQYELVYADEILSLVETDERLKSDPVHPNAEGYTRIAESVFVLMKTHGALQ